MKKYTIGIELGDYCIDVSDEYGWRGADYLEAEGSTLYEILDDAIIFLSDQDGGEAGQWGIGDFDTDTYELLEGLVEKEYNKQMSGE